MTKSVKVSSELYEKIVKLADKEGRKIKFIIDRALTNYLLSKKFTEK